MIYSFFSDQNLVLLKFNDINEETLYPDHWDTLLNHADAGADVDAATYATYQLTAEPVGPPANQAETQGKKVV